MMMMVQEVVMKIKWMIQTIQNKKQRILEIQKNSISLVLNQVEIKQVWIMMLFT